MNRALALEVFVTYSIFFFILNSYILIVLMSPNIYLVQICWNNFLCWTNYSKSTAYFRTLPNTYDATFYENNSRFLVRSYLSQKLHHRGLTVSLIHTGNSPASNKSFQGKYNAKKLSPLITFKFMLTTAKSRR